MAIVGAESESSGAFRARPTIATPPPTKRVRVGTHPDGQLVDGQRAVCHRIGHLQLGRRGDALGGSGAKIFSSTATGWGDAALVHAIQHIAHSLDDTNHTRGWNSWGSHRQCSSTRR